MMLKLMTLLFDPVVDHDIKIDMTLLYGHVVDTYFNALYTGLYHNKNEQGVNNTKYKMDTANVVAPLPPPVENKAKALRKLKNSAKMYTRKRKRMVK